MGARKPRVDERGRAFKGSQFQIQNAVNTGIHELNETINAALPELSSFQAPPEWLSPVETGHCKEYRGPHMLEVAGLGDYSGYLRDFWPGNGPYWDAFARVKRSANSKSGVILVEAKSYPREMFGGGCRASSPKSREKIVGALKRTQAWLGATDNPWWMGSLYQWGNRLAHLYFFRQEVQVEAWLVNAYFINDQTHHPTSHEIWTVAIEDVYEKLGLLCNQIPYHADVFLPASSSVVREPP